MKIVNYKYVLPDYMDTAKKANYIRETLDSRDKFIGAWNWKNYSKLINDIKPAGKTAVLYTVGPAEHHSCSKDYTHVVDKPRGVMPVQSQLGFIASKVAKHYNADYLSINSNTCAATMYALYEAEILLDRGYDDVIIYCEEWVEDLQLLLFEKSGIDVVCSDAFAILHIQKGDQISDVNWVFNSDSTPFTVSKDGYIKSMAPFKDLAIDAVKTHGTQTPQNTEAENSAIEELFGEVPLIEYKKEIGHTQGCSTAIELCMLLDREKSGTYLVNASGLGNFYGSCVIDV